MSAELTVLLVEDNTPDAAYIEELFRDLDWPDVGDQHLGEPQLVHVETVRDAVGHIETGDVDVVLLDLNLPDSTGLETVDSVLAAATDEPVVVLTGLTDERIGVEAVERGAQDYLVKDEVTATLLGRTIRYALERQRRERTLEQRNEELTLLNRLVRHDIRDDMALICGWGQPLTDHIDPAGERHLDRILEASNHVIELTDTVAEFLDVLQDREEVTLRPFRLDDTLHVEVDKAQSVHTDATIEVSGDLPAVEVAATELLSSVFRNLLANAVQHNDSDNPHVTVSATVDEGTVTVAVADDGPGIPEGKTDAIFGRTERGLAHPECGVGLYLVDTLVEMYDGEITVRDNEPRGSVFEVTLNRTKTGD